MNRRVLAVVVGLLLSVSGRASAASFGITFNGFEVTGLPAPVVGNPISTLAPFAGYIYACGADCYNFSTHEVADPLAYIGASAEMDSDPDVGYTLMASNLGANVTASASFGFTFATPFVGGPYHVLSQSIAGNITSGASEPQQFVAVTGVIGVVDPACDGAPTCSSGLFTTAVTTAATGTLQVNTVFSLYGGGSTSLNGTASITQPGTAVPEPATLLLLGIGMGALATRRRRSQK